MRLLKKFNKPFPPKIIYNIWKKKKKNSAQERVKNYMHWLICFENTAFILYSTNVDDVVDLSLKNNENMKKIVCFK